jgi:hypothetical protein
MTITNPAVRRTCAKSREGPSLLGYVFPSRATNSQKDATKISPMQLALCGLDGLLYTSPKGKPGRSS